MNEKANYLVAAQNTIAAVHGEYADVSLGRVESDASIAIAEAAIAQAEAAERQAAALERIATVLESLESLVSAAGNLKVEKP